MSHGHHVQHRIVADGHLKTLVEALDPNLLLVYMVNDL